MEWTFTLKDSIYIIIQLCTVIGFLFALNFKVRKLEESNQLVKKVMFQDRGGLNLVDNETCKSHRDQVHTCIRNEAAVNRRAFEHIDVINQNIIQIMMHLKIQPKVLDGPVSMKDVKY